MAENVINRDVVSCDQFNNHEQLHSVKKYTFVNLKDKSRGILRSVENLSPSSSTSSSDKRFTVGGSRCDVATPQPGSSNEIPRKGSLRQP